MTPTTVTTASPSGVVVVLAIAGALIAALVLAEVLAAAVRALGHRSWLAENLSRRCRLPMRAVLVVLCAWFALRLAVAAPPAGPAWRLAAEHVALVALILSAAWLVGALAFVVEDAALARYRMDVPDNRHARRVRTQVSLLRRLTVALLVLGAIAGVLLTFEDARTFGAGLLASAGLLSVVVGLAAQTSLANVFAGVQLAFTDAIRVDDVVVVDGEWGRIEEITLTYVVVHVWDDRRLILPSTWFTTTPFQNWTRRAADLLGTVELDLDWTVPVPALRAELVRLLQESDLWDHRVGVLQVTEATGGYVRVRALASAVDAPTLYDLRCELREGLVDWLQREHPHALPRQRWEGDPAPSGAAAATRPPDAPRPAVPPAVQPAEQPAVQPDAGHDEASSSPAAPGDEGPVVGGATAPTPPLGTGVPRRRRALPRPGDPSQTVLLDPGRDSRLFTGSLAAVERSKAFAGPGEEVIAEREQSAERLLPRHRPPPPRTDGA
ncbi:mechanosensitive ion channel domain-containing protein [Actinotalea sp.]|uniref:mechanosensitive ion channel family protein n=1 Tax=Actinotalea sp. TaxID=1872145 RepID=UPI002B8E7916|nr:mechanosensitive ion channel domain-containing protein [Actinotalea sp.]HQY34583.1 mechanosensitive ion channel [Actinotalea sp.]HRA51316.1 mechanosensitive ion channel [Actinotalea sp.]